MGTVLGHGQREDVELGRIELLHIRLILPYVTGHPQLEHQTPYHGAISDLSSAERGGS